MKFILWGRIEGIRADAVSPCWVGIEDNRVIDLSAAARAAGIRTGFSAAAAQALLPEIEVQPLRTEPSDLMQQVWQTVYDFTPWLQTVGLNGFCAQITHDISPLAEVRQLLERLASQLAGTGRLTLGLARLPEEARTVVAWHDWALDTGGALPPGMRIAFESHVLLCAAHLTADIRPALPVWLTKLPIPAAWFIPAKAQAELMQLGIHTYGGLLLADRDRLLRRFGKEAAAWLQWFELAPYGIQSNYPPRQLERVWQAAAGESVSGSCFNELLDQLLTGIGPQMERNGLGAETIELEWITEAGHQHWQRRAGQLTGSPSAWRVLAEPAASTCEGQQLEQMRVVLTGVRPLQSVQAALLPKSGTSQLSAREARALQHLCQRIERRYPGAVAFGLKPSFRELRWRALSEQ